MLTVQPATFPHNYGRSPLGDEQERKRALHALHGNIWHQHTIYEATAFAVPFLVELVQNHVPHRKILSLIALIALSATASSYMGVHQSLLRKCTAEDEEQLQREQQWVKAAKSAVAAHSGFFFELMNSSNRRIRELCILILGAVEMKVRLMCRMSSEEYSASNKQSTRFIGLVSIRENPLHPW